MTLIHVRIGRELKRQMKVLIDSGLFSNQAEIVREGIRELLIKYKDTIKKSGKR